MTAWLRVAPLLFTVAWGTNHFVPLLLVYRARLALSSVDLAVLFGVYAIGLVPGLVVGGPLSDRIGRRAVVLPAAAVALCGTAILSFGGAGFALLLAGRLVVGLGSGATFSAGTAWLQDLAHGQPPGTGARRASIALSLGFGGGPLVTGLVAQWLPSPMVLPYVVQATVLVAALTFASAAGAPSPRDASARKQTPRAHGFPRVFMRDVVPVAPWVFVFPSISHAVFPAMVRDRVGPLVVAYAGAVTATTLLSGVLVQPILRAWEPRRAGAFGLAAGALGVLVGTVAAARGLPGGVLAAAVLLGAGYGGCLISGLRTVEIATPPSSRGRVLGAFYVLAYLGFASPLLLAAFARRFGDAPGLVATALGAAATAMWIRFARVDRATEGARDPACPEG